MTAQTNHRRALLRSLAALPFGIAGAAAMTSLSRPAKGGENQDLATQVAYLTKAAEITDAHQQITKVLHLYARGWDRRDEAALKSCFHPDSTHQHGGFDGLSLDFVAGGLKATENVRAMSHLITNITIDIAGDKAVSESYFLAHHRRPQADGNGEEDMFIKGRYLDRFEKRDGLWKIAHRRGLSDFTRVFAPANTALDGAPAEQLSALKPEDPLYKMLAELYNGNI